MTNNKRITIVIEGSTNLFDLLEVLRKQIENEVYKNIFTNELRLKMRFFSTDISSDSVKISIDIEKLEQ